MRAIKRIEIIVSKRGAEQITDLLSANGIIGFSKINKVEGSGDSFSRDGDYPSDIFSNQMIIVGCEQKQFESIKEDLRKILSENSGVCMVSDAEWLIH